MPRGRTKAQGKPANLHGVKGKSGRKSMIAEVEKARLLSDSFYGEGVDMEKIKKIQEVLASKKGKIKLFDLVLVKAITKDPILMALFNKLHPDKLILGGDVDLNIGDVTRKKLKELDQ